MAAPLLLGLATIVPRVAFPPMTPLTSQITLALLLPVTVPVKFAVAPSATVAVVGESVTTVTPSGSIPTCIA